MAIQVRKMLSDSDIDIFQSCESLFCVANNYLGHCPAACLDICPDICHLIDPALSMIPPQSSPPPPPPPSPYLNLIKPHKLTLLYICLISIVSIGCVLAFVFVFYRRFYSRRFASPARSQPQPPESYDEFVDEEEGPILDHPIWYIRTVGLQPSVINAITICKYKRGDGLIEGTDCSVCLTEFEEDESLRLLPKCNHAFHLPCIDTWLRSHTNCPLCRAPVVAAVAVPSEPEPLTSVQAEEIRPENSENMGGLRNTEEEEEDGDGELAVVDDGIKGSGENSIEGEGEMQPVRRSVSLDSLSAFQISRALSRVSEAQKSGLDQIESGKENGVSRVEMSSKRKGKNQNFMNLVSASSSGKCVDREFMKRSLSCTSKFFLRTSSTQRKNGVIPT